jgi:hypothetical protein
MTRLINMDNGGTLTDFCLIDSEEVRYTKTLTTPCDLSRCLLDGLAKVSELAYGEPQLATRAVHRLHPVFHHPGHQRSRAAGRTAAMPAGRRSDAGRGPGGHLGPGGSADGTGRRPGGPDQPEHRRGGAEPRAARGSTTCPRAGPGHRSERRGRRGPGEGIAAAAIPVICSARSRCCSPRNWSPTPYDIRAPGRACSTRSCTRPLSASCSTPTGGCETPRPRAVADLPLRLISCSPRPGRA